MPVTELERSAMVEALKTVFGPKITETIMDCILPDGSDQLATKEDLKLLELSIANNYAELKRHVDTNYAELKSHVDNSVGELHTDCAELRSEFTKWTRLILVILAMHFGLFATLFGVLINIALSQ